MGVVFGRETQPVDNLLKLSSDLPVVQRWDKSYERVRDDYNPLSYPSQPLVKFYSSVVDNFRVLGCTLDGAINGRPPSLSHAILYLDLENNRFEAELRSPIYEDYKIAQYYTKGSFKLIDTTKKKQIEMIYEAYSVRKPGKCIFGHDEYSERTNIPPVNFSGKVKTVVKKIQDFDDESNLNVIFFSSDDQFDPVPQFEFCVYKPPPTKERMKELAKHRNEAYLAYQQHKIKRMEEKLKREKESFSNMYK